MHCRARWLSYPKCLDHLKLVCDMQVHAVHLTPEAFSVDNGLLTPSFKLKRPQAKAAFTDEIAALYRALDGAAT